MKEKIRGSLPDLLAILIGNLFLALTVVLFVLPGELISCGTTGLSDRFLQSAARIICSP